MDDLQARTEAFKPSARQFKKLWLPIPVLLVFLAGCASSGNPSQTGFNFHQTLTALAAKHDVCGVAIAIVKNRKLDVLDSATGCQPAVAVHAESVFQAASLSKPVFAYAVLKLAAQGKLALDAPVVSYLPQGYRHRFNPLEAEPSDAVTDPRLQAVTARMVLQHMSGLPNWASGPLRFESTPGAKWAYSGEGYLLLQRAVETITGEPLDQFMAAQVFKPLAMARSTYVWDESVAQHLLPGTKANGAPRQTIALKEPVAAFTLYTTAADYAKFLVEVLNRAPMLQQLTVSSVTVDAGLNLSWGLGWGLERTTDDLYIWHWGNNPGYRAFVMASEQSGDGFVMLTNSENGLMLAQPITQKILPNEHKLFQSKMLEDGAAVEVCRATGLCL